MIKEIQGKGRIPPRKIKTARITTAKARSTPAVKTCPPPFRAEAAKDQEKEVEATRPLAGTRDYSILKARKKNTSDLATHAAGSAQESLYTLRNLPTWQGKSVPHPLSMENGHMLKVIGSSFSAHHTLR